jgi:hypothetical protein
LIELLGETRPHVFTHLRNNSWRCSDKVISLKSGEGEQDGGIIGRIQIDVDGAIETPDIRTAITSIMEGGRNAFDLRNRKYNFDSMED